MRNMRRCNYLWVLMALFLFSLFTLSSCILEEWMNPTRGGVPRPNVTMTPDQPAYIGQNIRVLVTMNPARKVDFIRLVVVNGFTGERRVIAEQQNVARAEFSYTIDRAYFAIVVETPLHTEATERAIWKPAKNAFYELRDATPPSVSVSVARVNASSNQHLVSLDIFEPHSKVVAQWIMVNGQRVEMSESEIQIPLDPGDYTIVGYARNSSNVEGRSASLSMRVAPPTSSAPPRFDLKTPTYIEAFKNETIFLMADIEDPTSFLRSIEIIHSGGGRRMVYFDPLEPRHSFRYSFKAVRSESVEVIITNGNGVTAIIRYTIVVKDHQAPTVILSTSQSGRIPSGSEIVAQIHSTAHNGERIQEVHLLVNNYTQRSFFPDQPTFSRNDLPYTVERGLQTLRAVVIDSRGARGYSDEIEIIGTIVDDTPPSIQLFTPAVAYLDIPVNISFLVWDRDSSIDGSPTLRIEEDNTQLMPSTFDGSFFTASWTPGSLGVKTVRANAQDTAGNTGFAVGTVQVKDPTGIVQPAVGVLGVEPNPVYLGNPVRLTIAITPPNNYPGEKPQSVTFFVTPPNAQGSHSISPEIPQDGQNLYRSTYVPTHTGVHIAQAEIWWKGNKFTTDAVPFTVDSPQPFLQFSVTPTETYVGNEITLRVVATPSNPNAQIESAEIVVDGTIIYPIATEERGQQKIYEVTTSTLNFGAGLKIATAKVTDSFGITQEKSVSFRLVNPLLRIDGWNINPHSGGAVSVMDPVAFEAFIADLIPPAVKVFGHVHIRPPEGPDVMVHMNQQPPPNHYEFHSKEHWVPKMDGTHTLILTMDALIGTATQTDTMVRDVVVSKSALDLKVTAADPGTTNLLDIDRIYVGMLFDFVFEVSGVPENDWIQDVVFSITQNGTVYLPESKPVREGVNQRYRYSMSPFSQSGLYTVHATVTTLVSEKGIQRPIHVLDSQIRKRTFSLIGDPNSLVLGQPMDFRLELDNPANTPLSINFFLVDENRQKLPPISPIVAEPNDPSNTVYQNIRSFSLTQAGTFTVAATVTMASSPPIELPTMFGDSFYFMPEPNINILVDDSKEYLLNYDGLVDITVTIPKGMEIQPPTVDVIGGAANVNPIPYHADTSSDSVHYYSYRIKPTQAASVVLDVRVYETKDFGRVNPVSTKVASLTVVPFQPQVIIQGKTTGSARFVQAKPAEIEMTISQVPEFFEGSFIFEPTLNAFNSTVFPVTSPTHTASALFDPQTLFNLLGADAATVIVTARSVGNETFIAQGTQQFDVDLPRISNVRFPSEVINADYIVYDQSELRVLFNNHDLVTNSNLIEVELLIFDGVSTKTYKTHPHLEPASPEAYALFSNVEFTKSGTHTAMAKVFCLNTNPKALLEASIVETLHVWDAGTFIDVTYPKISDTVFVGQKVRPIARLTNIPNVISVRLDIVDATTSATIVSNGRTIEATPNYWVLITEDAREIPIKGDYRVRATVQSSLLGTLLSDWEPFNAIDGTLSLVKIERTAESGGLLEVGEQLHFNMEYTFNNPYRKPETNATITLDTANIDVIRQGEPTVEPFGETFLYKEIWAATPGNQGEHKLEFSGRQGSESFTGEMKFMVVPSIEKPHAILANTEVVVGQKISGSITFSITNFLYDYADDKGINLWDYLDGRIEFPNTEGTARVFQIVDTGGNWDYIIDISATAREHSGGPGGSQTFTATFSYRIDNTQDANYKQIQYRIINPPEP